jgi:hypothetical protein
MKTATSIKKLRTTCGQEFDKSRLEMLLSQPLSFTRSNTAFIYYRTSEAEYIQGRHHYDFATDIISVSYQKITEKEARYLIFQGKTEPISINRHLMK